MHKDQFLVELKELVYFSDWHRRYYTARSRKYCRFDYWVRCTLGLIGALGAIVAANETLRIYGALMAGGCAFAIGTILPNFKWDSIVQGLKDEQEEWTRIFHGYEGLLRMSTMLDKDEILSLKFEEINAVKRASALNDRKLPEDNKLLEKIKADVRTYWNLLPAEEKPAEGAPKKG
jgi:hypothetical protein